MVRARFCRGPIKNVMCKSAWTWLVHVLWQSQVQSRLLYKLWVSCFCQRCTKSVSESLTWVFWPFDSDYQFLNKLNYWIRDGIKHATFVIPVKYMYVRPFNSGNIDTCTMYMYIYCTLNDDQMCTCIFVTILLQFNISLNWHWQFIHCTCNDVDGTCTCLRPYIVHTMTFCTGHGNCKKYCAPFAHKLTQFSFFQFHCIVVRTTWDTN